MDNPHHSKRGTCQVRFALVSLFYEWRQKNMWVWFKYLVVSPRKSIKMFSLKSEVHEFLNMPFSYELFAG